MYKDRLAYKVLLILSIALTCGFVFMGIITIWMQSNSTLDLQRKNAKNEVDIIVDEIKEYMVRGSAGDVSSFIHNAKSKQYVRDLKIFNTEGKELGAAVDVAANPSIMNALQTGKEGEYQSLDNGIHTLSAVIPIVNEERCHRCHEAGPKYRGAILLTSSIQDGYENIRNLFLFLLVTGIIFFFVLLGCIYFFMDRTIIRHIRQFAEKIEELANGSGDLTQTIQVSSKDEIGSLAAGLNRLISKMHEIISSIAHNAHQLSAAAHQVSATSERIANGINEVSVQTSGVATASEEMAATSNETAQNCATAAEESRKARNSAEIGTAVVNGTVSVMNQIAIKIKESAELITVLGKRSDQIEEIIEVIEGIADQTNLLALNAAIEAARAGEQGRGFTVVADEVRSLADRTTKATSEISAMIKTIQKETRGAVSTMHEVIVAVEKGTSEADNSGVALNNIFERVNSVTDFVNQISTAAEQQNATTTEISKNILQIMDAVKSSAKEAQNTSAVASQMAILSEDLKGLVGQFKLEA